MRAWELGIGQTVLGILVVAAVVAVVSFAWKAAAIVWELVRMGVGRRHV
jgi:hypothetical protein